MVYNVIKLNPIQEEKQMTNSKVLSSTELQNLINHIEEMMNSPQASPYSIDANQKAIDKIRIRLKNVLKRESK